MLCEHSLYEHLLLCAGPEAACCVSTHCVLGPLWLWLPIVCQELGFCVSVS